MTVKRCIDKAMARVVKSLRLPKYIKEYLTYKVLQDNTLNCYCIIIDDISVSKIPLQQFYTTPLDKIIRRVKYDLEQFILKVYNKHVKL